MHRLVKPFINSREDVILLESFVLVDHRRIRLGAGDLEVENQRVVVSDIAALLHSWMLLVRRQGSWWMECGLM